nr:uncharacterized protein LOC128686747 [Cherax quadricarinatus]
MTSPTTSMTSFESNTIGDEEANVEQVVPALLTLERKSDLRRSLLLIVVYMLMETGKQMSNFHLSISSEDEVPVSSTFIVLLTELTKLIIVLFWAAVSQAPVSRWRPSCTFSVPALCYFFTNILYLVSLRTVTPPLWMLLIQTRTLYTAASYLMVFGRKMTWVQMVGCLLLVGSVALARTSQLLPGSRTSVTSAVLVYSQLCALLSTAASVAVELLLKNNERSFCEQQAWLYLWGSLLGAITLPLQLDYNSLTSLLQSVIWSSTLLLRVLAAVVASALAGLCVPLIIRNLDSIVKDYLAALNNLLLSVVTAVVFPVHFTITWVFCLSLVLLLLGIWLYERKVLCHKS